MELQILMIRLQEIDQQISDQNGWLDSFIDCDPRNQEVLDNLSDLRQERACIALRVSELSALNNRSSHGRHAVQSRCPAAD